MRKRSFICFLIQLLFVSSVFAVPVSADSSNLPEQDDNYSFVFQNCDERQSVTYTDHSGLQTTVSIESTSIDGEKLISYSTAQLTMSFKIYIATGIIVSAYSGSYSTTYYDVTSTSLSVNSIYKATYTLYYKQHLSTNSIWLRATIVNDTIVVTHN